MRICVVGAGAIGGLLGTRLAMSGHDVGVLARGESLAAIAAHGLTVVEESGERVVAPRVRVSDDPGSLGSHDLVLLAVKAHQLPGVAAQIPTLCRPETAVVTMQNGIPWWFFQRFGGPYEGRTLTGLDPDGSIRRNIPAERVIGGIAYPAVARDAPGVARVIDGDRFLVGELGGEVSERASTVSDALRDAGFSSRVVRDIRTSLWVKAWGNLAFNPMSALTGATLGELCRDRATRALAQRMMSEAAQAAEHLGLRLRLSIESRIEGAAAAGGHETSMLQDARAGRPLEVEALVGSFAELGRLTGTPTPSIDVVYALVSALDARIREGSWLRADGPSARVLSQ